MSILNVLSGLFEPVSKLIDSLHTSGEEKAAAQVALLTIQNDFAVKLLEHEQVLVKEQAGIIRAEAQSESALTRNWRPIAMLFFLAIVGFAVFGGGVSPFTGTPIPEAYVTEALAIVKLGIGGYVLGRSAEKVTEKWKNGG